ncbi:hypothetical protein EVAR_70500_1 [Eumeta japonica]|uniref:Uncharacterized protein n=1 Tax=Eumeta variegata TaxID=151549 RepID=A0A4C2A849_EUMVA|nr:hypothetical protein EVAR_70500_1 [Eumeta japonica]
MSYNIILLQNAVMQTVLRMCHRGPAQKSQSHCAAALSRSGTTRKTDTGDVEQEEHAKRKQALETITLLKELCYENYERIMLLKELC